VSAGKGWTRKKPDSSTGRVIRKPTLEFAEQTDIAVMTAAGLSCKIPAWFAQKFRHDNPGILSLAQ
jgi:hypothetical protein